MKAKTISVFALLVVLCIASFVLWNFTKVAAKAVTTNDETAIRVVASTTDTDTTGTDNIGSNTDGAVDSSADKDSITANAKSVTQNDPQLVDQDIILAEIPASGMIELCEAVLPGNTITDTAIRQRGPQSLHWINELYQGDEGHLFLKYDFRESYSYNASTFNYLKRFNDVLAAHNIQLATLVLPPRTMIYHESLEAVRPYPLEAAYDSYLKSLEEVRALGIVAPDLAKPFLELAKEESVYFKRDHHWTPEAAQVTAKVLAEELKANEIYQRLTKKTYTTVQEGAVPLDDSTYMLRVEAVCGVEIEDEMVNSYNTILASTDTASSNSLFGDAPKIPVVLAGTSHSAKEVFNFSGFLQEELSTEVLNVAKESGGQFAGFMQYLPDETLRSTVDEPSLLIWEREFQGSLIKQFDNDFRQLIPSVYGVCSDDDAIAIRSLEATGGKALGIGVPKGISGTGYYVTANVADLSIRRPTAYLQYANGTEERIRLGNPRVRPKNYLLELQGNDFGDLERFVMEFPKDVFGTITLKICKVDL